MKKNKQSARSLTAFLVTWAFLVLMVTGIVLYVVPQGRVAYWIHWSLLGLEKEQWGWIHIMFGGVFIFTGFLHLYYNWKPFKKYFAARVQGHFELKREIVIATSLTVAIVALSALNLPPASWIIDLNSQVKESWITSPELEPPYGHAEESSIAGITRKMGLDLERGIAELRAQGIRFNDKRDKLEQIARENGVTPMDLYQLLIKHKKTAGTDEESPQKMSAEEVEVLYSGTGVGRKSVSDACDLVGVALEQCLLRLNRSGIEATAQSKLKPLADASQKTPIDLLVIMLELHQ